jgi:SAM-dependent methyltransferase
MSRRGLVEVIYAAMQRILPLEARISRDHRDCFQGKIGLELGGPSLVFRRRGPLPIYALAARVDNVNFAARTVWEAADEGQTFRFDDSKPLGHQFIDEAAELSSIATEAYDFVLASHMLEHAANPLKVLDAIRRVLRPRGALLVILPDPRYTFDHKRPVTTLAHLISDYERGTGEDDLTHLAEILDLHDLTMDRAAPQEPAEFRDRCLRNFSLRCIHHHVFEESLIREMVVRSGFRVQDFMALPPHHLICLAQAAGNYGV